MTSRVIKRSWSLKAAISLNKTSLWEEQVHKVRFHDWLAIFSTKSSTDSSGSWSFLSCRSHTIQAQSSIGRKMPLYKVSHYTRVVTFSFVKRLAKCRTHEFWKVGLPSFESNWVHCSQRDPALWQARSSVLVETISWWMLDPALLRYIDWFVHQVPFYI